MTPTSALALVIVLGEWTGLARAMIGAPVYAAALDIALAALVGWLAVRVIRARSFRPDRLSVLIGAYIVLSLVEMFNPNVPNLAAGTEGFRKTALTMVAFFVVRYSGDTDPRRFLKIVAVGSIPAFLWSIRQVISPLPIELKIITTSGVSSITFHASGVLRAFAPTAGPFHLGLLAACMLVVGLILSRSGRKSWPWLAFACLAAFVLGATLTRANVIAALCSLVVLVIGAPSLRERLRSVAPAAMIVAFMAFAAVFTVAIPTAGAPSPTSTPTPTPKSAAEQAKSVAAGVQKQLNDKNLVLRVGYWADFVQAIEAKPLIGYGTSSAGDGFSHYYSGTGRSYFDPHSLYLKPGLELGLGGMAIILVILILGVRVGLRALRADRAIGLVWLGVLTAVAVSGVTGPMLDAYPVNLFFWSMFGWAALVAYPRPKSSPVPSIEDASPA